MNTSLSQSPPIEGSAGIPTREISRMRHIHCGKVEMKDERVVNNTAKKYITHIGSHDSSCN